MGINVPEERKGIPTGRSNQTSVLGIDLKCMKQVLVMEMSMSYYGTCVDENTQNMFEREAKMVTLINDEWSEHSTR